MKRRSQAWVGSLLATLLAGCALSPQPDAGELLALQRSALTAYYDGPPARAESLLAEWVNLDPAAVEPRFRLANLLARQGRHAEAVHTYRGVLALDPNHPKALHNLAVVALRLSRDSWAALHGQATADPALRAWAGTRHEEVQALLAAGETVPPLAGAESGGTGEPAAAPAAVSETLEIPVEAQAVGSSPEMPDAGGEGALNPALDEAAGGGSLPAAAVPAPVPVGSREEAPRAMPAGGAENVVDVEAQGSARTPDPDGEDAEEGRVGGDLPLPVERVYLISTEAVTPEQAARDAPAEAESDATTAPEPAGSTDDAPGQAP